MSKIDAETKEILREAVLQAHHENPGLKKKELVEKVKEIEPRLKNVNVKYHHVVNILLTHRKKHSQSVNVNVMEPEPVSIAGLIIGLRDLIRYAESVQRAQKEKLTQLFL